MKMRGMNKRIVAEDLDWSLVTVPCLSTLCLQSIVRHFEEKPIFDELTSKERDFVQERLPTSLPLHVTAGLISDGVYWKRCCKQRWDRCYASDYDNSWKRMFFEKHMENLIELFIPGGTNPETVLEMVPLCKNYIKRLDISQLLLPIKEPQKVKEDQEELASENEYEGPSVDHFDFTILLNKLTNLEELHLVYKVKRCGMNFEWKMFEMTDRDCESLAMAVKSCKTLKLLHIYGSHIDDKKCCLLVKGLLDHPSLKTLDFSYNLIGDSGASAVCKLLTRSQLDTINMCFNNIRDPGAKAIAQALSTNSTLQTLNLCLNRVTDEGGQAICEALLSNSTLLHLNLGANVVTGPTAIALAKVLVQNKTLKSFNISGNNLGVDGGKALAEAMSHNTSVTECNLGLTEADEQSMSFIDQVVQTNKSLEQKRRPRESKTKETHSS